MIRQPNGPFRTSNTMPGFIRIRQMQPAGFGSRGLGSQVEIWHKQRWEKDIAT